MDSQAQPTQDMDMTPEEAKASLGIATFLQQQMIPQGVPLEESEPQEMGPETDDTMLEEDPNEDVISEIEDLRKDVDTLKKEKKEDQLDAEIKDIRQQLEELLKDDDQ